MRVCLLAMLAVLASSAVAIADHDHHAAPFATTAATSFDATATVEAAAIAGGSFQGVTPALGIRRGRLGVMVAAPVYRLDRDEAVVGPGDVLVRLDGRALDTGRGRAGAAVMVSLPTGSVEDRLGMGHVMAMPAIWASVGWTRLRLDGSLGVARALGADPHAHHHAGGMSGPLVDPMNAFEAGGALRLTFAATAALELAAIGSAATPIGDGVTRATAGAGVTRQIGAWSAGVEVLIGVVGAPFTSRIALALARTF